MRPLPPPAADSEDPRRARGPGGGRRDAAWLLLLLALGLWLALDSVVLPPTIQMDAQSYLAMADDPAAYLRVPEVHAQRPLPPFLVWVLGGLGISAPTGFRLLSVLSFHAFAALFFLTLRGASVRGPVAFGTTVFALIGSWPVAYPLSNVYQACDAMAYPLGLALVVGVAKRRPGVAVPAALAGVLVRQQLFVLAVGGLIAGYRRTGRRVWLGALAAVLVLFGALVATAGGGGGASLWGHTGARLLDVSALVRGAWETRLPVLLSPFLLVLLLDARALLAAARRWWWVTLYVVATVLQPLLAFPMTGASNAVRLAMLGVWPLFLLAGVRLDRRWLVRPWSRRTYAALPLLYGTGHLVSVAHTWPSPVGHRTVLNVVLVGLALLSVRGDAAERAGRPASEGLAS